MRTNRPLISKFRNQRGVTAVIVAIVIAMLIGFVALAVDIGYVAATKNELQNVADSAALAGAGQLGDQYIKEEPIDDVAIKDVAEDAGIKNKAGGEVINIIRDEIKIGTWDQDRDPKFVPNTTDPFVPDGDENAVEVTTRRDSAANGPITTFFAKIFGISTADVRADATAALTPVTEVGPGEMNMPIGLSENWFDPPHCEDTIRFSPTTDSCAGWHNFFDAINANAMADKLLGFIVDDPTIHDTNPANDPDPYGECVLEPCGRVDPNNTADVSWIDVNFDMNPNQVPDPMYTLSVESEASFFEFQGGTISALFNGGKLDWEDDPGDGTNYIIPKYNIPDDPTSGQVVLDDEKHPAPFFAIFDYFRFRDEISIPDEGLSFDTDGDGTNDLTVTHPDAVWSGVVPVYEDEDECINPNTSLKIVGFAIIHVVMPNPPPDSTILARIDCEMKVIEGRGGGGTVTTLVGYIPQLVE